MKTAVRPPIALHGGRYCHGQYERHWLKRKRDLVWSEWSRHHTGGQWLCKQCVELRRRRADLRKTIKAILPDYDGRVCISCETARPTTSGFCSRCQRRLDWFTRAYKAIYLNERGLPLPPKVTQARAKACPEGHPFSPKNTRLIVRPSQWNYGLILSRVCRLCDAEACKRQRVKRKVKAYRQLIGPLTQAA